MRDLDIHSDVILLQTSSGYRRSDDYGANWQLVNPVLNGLNLVWQEGTWFASGKLSKTDIEHLPSGQYIVRWISGTGVQKTGKVLKR